MPNWKAHVSEARMVEFQRQWRQDGPDRLALLKALGVSLTESQDASRLVLLGESHLVEGYGAPREVAEGEIRAIRPGLVLLLGNDVRMTGLLERDGEQSVRTFMFDAFASFYIWPTHEPGREPQGMFKAFFQGGFETFMAFDFNRDEGYSYGISNARWKLMRAWLDTYLPV